MVARGQYTPGNGGTFICSPARPSMPGAGVALYTGAISGPAAAVSAAATAAAAATAVFMGIAAVAAAAAALQPVQVQVKSAGHGADRVQPDQVIIPQLSDSQLSDMTAAIALYPDPILAEMFPAATYVEELTYADRWMARSIRGRMNGRLRACRWMIQ